MRDDGRVPAELGLETAASISLLEVLETLAGEEERLTAELYPLFFARRPDAVSLFGVHALAEREEMLRETLRSLLALAERQPWLVVNLEALGRSHFEYGVTGDMYDDFVETFLEAAEQVAKRATSSSTGMSPDAVALGPSHADALRRGLAAIAGSMRRAGDEAARSHGPERLPSPAPNA